jgi:hypothetical protein
MDRLKIGQEQGTLEVHWFRLKNQFTLSHGPQIVSKFFSVVKKTFTLNQSKYNINALYQKLLIPYTFQRLDSNKLPGKLMME